jgi:RecG-like helicase
MAFGQHRFGVHARHEVERMGQIGTNSRLWVLANLARVAPR